MVSSFFWATVYIFPETLAKTGLHENRIFSLLIMAALWNRACQYIFVLWFLLSFFLFFLSFLSFLLFFLSFFFPRLFSAVAYWMSTILPHMVRP